MIEKIIVKSPATSANFGCGFDCVGIAYNAHNTFIIYPNQKKDDLPFRGEKLLRLSYEKAFAYKGETPVPMFVRQIQGLPSSRGLGSSATSIIGGILGANELMEHKLSQQEILDLATEIEGHPDNVAPCFLGGFVASIKGLPLMIHKMGVNNKLRFILLSPNFEMSTQKARAILPEKITMSDAVYDLSRAFFLEDALKYGDLNNLRLCLDDKWHVPYRKDMIKDYAIFEQYAAANRLPFTISGSGSTLLMISDKEHVEGHAAALKEMIDKKIYCDKMLEAQWSVKVYTCNTHGATTEVIYEK